MYASNIEEKLIALSNTDKALVLSSFFQTKEGQYAHGDLFLGVTVPNIRKTVAPYLDLQLNEVEKLLQSEYHECRFAALVILVHQFEKGSESEKETLYNFYLNNTQYINNWDLVDLSAHKIVGPWLLDKDRSPLYSLSKSSWLWDQCIAIVATWTFIRNKQYEDTLQLTQYFLSHSHHLIHKACGWMLREVGKQDKSVLTHFLNQFAPKMPRVMLRYSIEKLSKEERKNYLRAKIK